MQDADKYNNLIFLRKDAETTREALKDWLVKKRAVRCKVVAWDSPHYLEIELGPIGEGPVIAKAALIRHADIDMVLTTEEGKTMGFFDD